MAEARRVGLAFAGACVLALGVVLAAYSNTFQNSFHFDDAHVVLSNFYIRTFNVPLFFRDASTGTSLPANAVYRPLVTTSLALDYALAGGLHVRQFHLSQVTMLAVLWLLELLLFLTLLGRTGSRPWHPWAALAGATLCCVHTTVTETMNLMHARSELLSAIGIVGSFLLYLRAPRLRVSGLYLVPMALGALAKSPSVMFAPLLVVYLALFEEGLALPDLTRAAGWRRLAVAIRRGLPALVVGGLVFYAVTSMDAPTLSYSRTGAVDYLRTQFFVWLHYGRLFLLPIGLTADTDWTVITQWYDTRVVAGIAFVALLLWAMWRTSADPETRPVSFGLAWFALALLPASSIVPLAEVSNEHRVFFPYIGLTLAAVTAVAVALERRAAREAAWRAMAVPVAVVLTMVVVGGNAVGAYSRNRVWLTEETLWKDVSEKSPANGRGLMNYGLALMGRGNYPEAKAYFDRALFYNPNYATLEVNLGIVTDRLGQPEEAERHFARALQLGPDEPSSHTFYARWLLGRGRSLEAVPHLQRALALSPGDSAVRSQLFAAYANLGRAAELKQLVTETLAINPNDAEARRFLDPSGNVIGLATVAQAAQAAPAAPQTADDFMNASLRAYQVGDFKASIDAAQRALTLKPDYAEAYNNIAAANASLQQWDAAIAAAREALRLKPDFALAKGNLAWAERGKATAGGTSR